MIGKSKTQRIYKAIRNYLCNEMQVNRSYIDSLIAKKVDERIDHIIHQKLRNVEEVISNRVTQVLLSENFKHDYRYNRQELSKYVQNEIKQIVHEIIDSKISINVESKSSGPLA